MKISNKHFFPKRIKKKVKTKKQLREEYDRAVLLMEHVEAEITDRNGCEMF
jgi:hypothetical protein